MKRDLSLVIKNNRIGEDVQRDKCADLGMSENEQQNQYFYQLKIIRRRDLPNKIELDSELHVDTKVSGRHMELMTGQEPLCKSTIAATSDIGDIRDLTRIGLGSELAVSIRIYSAGDSGP